MSYISMLSNTVATSHIWLLSYWNMASAAEEMNFLSLNEF